MDKTSQHKYTDESDDNDTYAINALKDFDGIVSDSGLDIEKLHLSSDHQTKLNNNATEKKEKTVSVSHKNVSKSRSNESTTSNSTYSDVSTPPMDSKSVSTTPNRTMTSKTNRSGVPDVGYSSDFTDDTGESKDKMTAWERWFVMKQRQIRLRAEIEKKKKTLEEQKVKQLQQKKAEDNERKQKLWLDKKKQEESDKKEKDKEMKAKNNKGNTRNEYEFEKWYSKKLEEKKSQLQFHQELRKYEELQKEMRRKKNEKAQMEWMYKAKQRPNTPRITYAYVGDSVIGFYDSTSHPPPTYINPIPWQT